MAEPTVATAAVSPPSPSSPSHNVASNHESSDVGSSSPASPDDYMKPQQHDVLQQVRGLELPSEQQQQGNNSLLPPPERKKYTTTSSSDASTASSTDPPTIYASTGTGSNSSLNNTPNDSHHSTTTPTELFASTSNKANNTNKQQQASSTSSGSRSKKFQFYVPTATGDAHTAQQQLGSSNRSGGGSSISDLDIIAEDYTAQQAAEQGGGVGGGQKKIKGIDPPEIEPPTANHMDTSNLSVGMSGSAESAYKARSRLIQLQHRGGHNQGNSGSGGKKQKQQQKQQQQKSSSQSQSHSQRSGNNNRTVAGGGSDEDDDDDYPLVTNIDPVESDDDNDDDTNEQQQRQSRRYSSPPEGTRSPNTIDASYMNNYPSSAPQRPSHKLPPQQLMQYLHAGGRGSFSGRQGQQQGGQQQQFPPPGSGQPGMQQQQQGPGGGNNNVNIFPNMPLSNSLSQQMQQQQLHDSSMQHLPQRHQQPHIQQQQQQQQQQKQYSQRKQQPSQKLHRSLQPTQNNPQYRNLGEGGGSLQQPRRQSDDPYLIYSDGIDLLEKAASSSNVPRDEVDTLNDGISYLRNLEKEMATTGTGDITPSSAQQIMMEEQELIQAYAPKHSPRKKKTVPPPPPPPNHSYNKVQLVPTKRSQQHRPPPKIKSDAGASGSSSSGNRSRSNSLGDEMEKLAMAINNSNNSQQQQQKYRPPPPRNKPPPDHQHPASPTNIRKRPVITAASALDYVMSASPMDYHHTIDNDDDNNGVDDAAANINNDDDVDDLKTSQESPRAQEVSSYIDAIMNEDGGTDAIANITKSEELLNVLVDDLVDDDSSSDSLGYDTDHDEEFERQSSLSMHAEDKFLNPSGNNNSSSRYAEDKQGLSMSIDRLERLTLNSSPRQTTANSSSSSMHASDPSFHLRKGTKKKGSTSNLHDDMPRKSSMDPPENEIDSNNNSMNNDHEMSMEDHEHSEGLSPSVLPMRTMNERLYAVEAVIPTPTRYDDEYADDVDSFDQAMPRMDGSATTSSHALGPRSQRPGGITGVVLDVSDKQRRQDTVMMERERRLSGSPLESSSSQSSTTTTTSDEDDENTPQSALGDDHHPLDTMSFGNRQAASLMMKLCSHLLPVGLINDFDARTDSSLSSLLIQNKSMLEWDDEDPDEPGYVVHRLTNSQLVSVENAFEKMVSAIERSSVTHVRNGSNNDNFERDLEEAEMILDQEEKRYESEVIKKKSSIGSSSTKASDSSKNKVDNGTELQLKQRQHSRDSVPDFPGIYPPGKGKAGEMECFYLPIITKSEKTGFEPTKDLVLNPGSVFANNYLVQSELGSAAFSTAYRCLDLSSEEDEDGYQDEVCLKVIKNTKDYFDQSLDEIKILQLLKDTGRVQENNIVEMKSFFYHREHLVIVTELLRQNLYEFGKSILESRGPLYFTRLRLSHITRQCLIALKFVHDLGLMHCDIKPENILLSSYSRALVKVIDFGSSSFVTDRQSSYIQSRSYRAPEVILGLPYDGKIDIWSLGCVVAEMYTNEVTFQNDSELSMLSRIEAICGPFPRHMIANGRNSHRIFTDSGLIYEKISSDEVDDEERLSHCSSDDDADKSLYNVYQPKMTTVAARLGFDEDFMDQPKLSEDDKKRALFVDFVSKLLTVDPDSRPSAAEALNHPWITSSLALSEDDIKYGPERI